MRTTVVILLSALFSLIAFKELTYLAFFKANQAYIAENYCINKESKACAGHCQLSQIIAKGVDTSSETEVPMQMQEPVKLYYLSQLSPLLSLSYYAITQRGLPDYTFHHSYLYKSQLLRPPIV